MEFSNIECDRSRINSVIFLPIKLAADSLKNLFPTDLTISVNIQYISTNLYWFLYYLSIGFCIIYIAYMCLLCLLWEENSALVRGLYVPQSFVIINSRNDASLKVFHHQINSIVTTNLSWPRIYKKLMGREREANRNEKEERVRDEQNGCRCDEREQGREGEIEREWGKEGEEQRECVFEDRRETEINYEGLREKRRWRERKEEKDEGERERQDEWDSARMGLRLPW